MTTTLCQLKMKEIVVCSFYIYCMFFFRVSNGQSVQLEYLSDQCDIPETMLFKVTVNTTDATNYTLPYTIELFAYTWRVCEIMISSEGCFSGSQSFFSYCVQHEEDNYFISIAVSTSQNFFDGYYYYYYYFASSYCLWRAPNYFWKSNIVRIPLFFPDFNFIENNIFFDFKYSLVGNSSPALINTTSIQDNNWSFNQDANISFVIGTEIIKLNKYYYSNEFQLNVSKQYDIVVFDEDLNCSYVCDGLDVSVRFLEFEYAEEGNLTNLTFSIPATSSLIFNHIDASVIADHESFYMAVLTRDYDMVLRKYSMSFRCDMDWSSHLAFHAFYAYNTTFCRTNKQNVQLRIPKAAISPDCPSGLGVKNGHIRRGTTATCKCQIVRQSRPAAYVQWFTENNQSVASSGEISDLTLTSNTTGSNTSYNCFAISENGQVSGGTFVPKFYEEPKVVNFTVNGSKSVSVHVNNSVTFYCQVEADPPARAVLTGSALGQVQENTSAGDVLELTLNDLQCEDSGRYFCNGRNGFEDNATSSRDFVDVNVTCAPKLKNVPDKIPSIQASPNQNTVFTLEVYGYPEPTDFGLKIETGRSTSAVNKGKYSFSYLPLTPPFGLVTLTIYDANTKGTTTYILSVRSEAGEIEMKLKVVKEEQTNIEGVSSCIAKEDAYKPFTIGVSVVCGVLALGTIIAVAVHLRRRNETICGNQTRNQSDTSMSLGQNLKSSTL